MGNRDTHLAANNRTHRSDTVSLLAIGTLWGNLGRVLRFGEKPDSFPERKERKPARPP
jgi:hypothetical protein